MKEHDDIEEQHRKVMESIAGVLANLFKGYGFTLMVFPWNSKDGRMNYISNAKREDMATTMREFIGQSEGWHTDVPGFEHMQPHQQRVVLEKMELDAKLKKLSDFMATALSRNFSIADQEDLHDQKLAMEKYSAVLGKRIAKF